jgi:putative copper export protein
VLHVIGYLAMAVLLGGLFFVTALWPAGAEERRTRILLGGAAATGFAAALAGVRVAVRQVSPLPVREALAQHFGRVAVAESLMWLLTGVVVVAVLQHPGVVRTAAWRVGAVAVAVGLIRTTGMSAHGTQGKDATTGIVVDFLHLAGVSAWVGGLTVLTVVLLPRRRLPEIAAVVPRFSAIAASSAILVLMSGLVLAWQLVGSLHALFSTHYGHVLVVKLVLVGLLLLTALVSKRWVELRLERAVAAGGIDAVRSFAVSVGVEAALVLGVLGAASVLVTSSPGM